MVEEEKQSSTSEVTKPEIIHDHPVFKKVEDGDLETVQNYFEVEGLSLEIEDQHGMTPLMHASWKGTVEVAKYLLKQGADPNGGNHEHNYTCLHFAGLAGKPEICSLLLEAGAKTYHTNSVNRSVKTFHHKSLKLVFLKIQNSFSNGSFCWEPQLCVCDQ